MALRILPPMTERYKKAVQRPLRPVPVEFDLTFLEQGWCQLRFPSMHTSTQYGTFAEECDRLAKEAQAERHRMVLKEMAEAWRKLAEGADRIGEQPRP